MAQITRQRRSLLSSQSRIQVPWIKVTIGDYTFGVFDKKTAAKNAQGIYSSYHIQYPNYIQDLSIVKINGQFNQYSLNISYPVGLHDDPNFFEKVFSSVSNTRKIVFTYGDAFMPSYVYKEEEAIITQISSHFAFGSGGTMSAVISYTVSAVSSAALGKTGSFTFMHSGPIRPSEEIKRIFNDSRYGLQQLFTGMGPHNIDSLIESTDARVDVDTKTNISPLDYITYLVSCMIPEGTTASQTSKDIYILTFYDDTIYDQTFTDIPTMGGPYFRVSSTSYAKNYADAYEVDIGYNTNVLVTNFQIDNNENYSILYDYSNKLYPQEYTRRINDKGLWEDVYAPTFTSKNERRATNAEDMSWYTKLTKYPISGSITVQGLLRPAALMTYLRLNVIFPGGHRHITSGLYIVTRQQDYIGPGGYKTTLALTRIDGDYMNKDYFANMMLE